MEVKPCSTPMVPHVHFTKDDGDSLNGPEKYSQLVGRLNYLTVTHSDVAYAISVATQFIYAPALKHWKTLKQILCYLKGVSKLVILFRNHEHAHIQYFTNVN